MRKRRVPAALLVLAALMGCSPGITTENTGVGPTTTVYDPLAVLRLRVNQSFTQYVERALDERPGLTAQKPRAEVLSCTVAASLGIAESILLARLTQSPSTSAGLSESAELAVNEALSAAQSQVEMSLARCAQNP